MKTNLRTSMLCAALSIALVGGTSAQTTGTVSGTQSNAGKTPALTPATAGNANGATTAPAGTATGTSTLSLPAQNSAGVPGAPLTAGTGQAAISTRVPARGDNATSAFRALDPANRGYVTRADTDRISGFTGFDNADTDRDGRLTAEEFYAAWQRYSQ